MSSGEPWDPEVVCRKDGHTMQKTDGVLSGGDRVQHIAFPSDGATLRGLLYLPLAQTGKLPVVLLIVAPQDEMVHTNYAVARQANDSIPGPKQGYDIAAGACKPSF
jgi:hypothetical protein